MEWEHRIKNKKEMNRNEDHLNQSNCDCNPLIELNRIYKKNYEQKNYKNGLVG